MKTATRGSTAGQVRPLTLHLGLSGSWVHSESERITRSGGRGDKQRGRGKQKGFSVSLLCSSASSRVIVLSSPLHPGRAGIQPRARDPGPARHHPIASVCDAGHSAADDIATDRGPAPCRRSPPRVGDERTRSGGSVGIRPRRLEPGTCLPQKTAMTSVAAAKGITGIGIRRRRGPDGAGIVSLRVHEPETLACSTVSAISPRGIGLRSSADFCGFYSTNLP